MAGQGQNADPNENGVLGDNVVRFPRDWIGSLDELVPIGPERAVDQDGGPVGDLEANDWERSGRDRDEAGDLSANDDADWGGEPDADGDPDAIWGEQTEMLHRPLTRADPSRRARRRIVRSALVAALFVAVAALSVSLLTGGGPAGRHLSARVIHAPATTAAQSLAATRGRRLPASTHRNRTRSRRHAGRSQTRAAPSGDGVSAGSPDSSGTNSGELVAPAPGPSTAAAMTAATAPPADAGASTGTGGLPRPSALAPAAP